MHLCMDAEICSCIPTVLAAMEDSDLGWGWGAADSGAAAVRRARADEGSEAA